MGFFRALEPKLALFLAGKGPVINELFGSVLPPGHRSRLRAAKTRVRFSRGAPVEAFVLHQSLGLSWTETKQIKRELARYVALEYLVCSTGTFMMECKCEGGLLERPTRLRAVEVTLPRP
jgi:hypothetical protein